MTRRGQVALLPQPRTAGVCSRVVRGGFWVDFALLLRSAFRLRDNAGFRGSVRGFRLPERYILIFSSLPLGVRGRNPLVGAPTTGALLFAIHHCSNVVTSV